MHIGARKESNRKKVTGKKETGKKETGKKETGEKVSVRNHKVLRYVRGLNHHLLGFVRVQSSMCIKIIIYIWNFVPFIQKVNISLN